MLEACSGFGFPTKTFYVCFARPVTQCNDLERDGATKTFLTGTVNYTLAAPADFLQQLVVTKFHLDSTRLLLPVMIVIERSQSGFEEANTAKAARRISKNSRAALRANTLNFVSLGTQWRRSLPCTDRKLP